MANTVPSLNENSKESTKENRRSNGGNQSAILSDRIDYKENKLFGTLKFQTKGKQIKEEDHIPAGPITPLTTWLKV